jgi:hypothetical protein
VDEKSHNLLVDRTQKYITLLSRDENLQPFSVQTMYARKTKRRGRGYAIVRDKGRANQKLQKLRTDNFIKF